jgi:hypothetical protein
LVWMAVPMGLYRDDADGERGWARIVVGRGRKQGKLNMTKMLKVVVR